MKAASVVVGFLIVATAPAQQQQSASRGAIYGVALGQDGQPAKEVGLTPSGPGPRPLASRLPHTKTNDAGEYRFERLDWGRYIVFGDDEDAGYSIFSTGTGGGHPAEVELKPDHPEAELNLHLPPKAGFLHINLTDGRTGTSISGMRISYMAADNPALRLFEMSSSSSHVVLVPADKDLLLHVTSDGYREWNESAGRGKPIHLPSGTAMTLEVHLEPSD